MQPPTLDLHHNPLATKKQAKPKTNPKNHTSKKRHNHTKQPFNAHTPYPIFD
jgi:hypothetical protein